MHKKAYTLLLLLSILCLSTPAKPQRLQRTLPEKVGLDSKRLTTADKLMQEAVIDSMIPGGVLAIVRHGKIAHIKAYGNRRLMPYKDRMTTNTIFDMASCSKPVSTASCIMKLVEEGKIRLTDPVELYIPGFKSWQSEDGKESTTIRIHHLLTHSSGLPAYASIDYLKKNYGETTPEALLDYICHCTRNFEPSTKFRYSCLNFITLQHIVEKISGQSLRDFAHDNIFGPLGMNHTDYLPCREGEGGIWKNTSLPIWGKDMTIEDALKNIAPTEWQKETNQVLCGQVHDPLARIMNHGISGNAGLFTCAEDLAIFCAMLQNGGKWNGKRIFSPLTVKALRSIPAEEATLGRTLGWDNSSPYSSNKGDLLSPTTYCHTGYTGTSIVIDPENDISIIFLINAVHPEDNRSTKNLRSRISNAVAASIID